MTPSRRHLFALLGLVLPVAAFTASPVAAATSSTLHHKPHISSHDYLAQGQAASLLGAQRIASHDAPHAEAYRELTVASLRAFASSSARSPARMRSGVGGQPPISRSTGKVAPTPPVTA